MQDREDYETSREFLKYALKYYEVLKHTNIYQLYEAIYGDYADNGGNVHSFKGCTLTIAREGDNITGTYSENGKSATITRKVACKYDYCPDLMGEFPTNKIDFTNT